VSPNKDTGSRLAGLRAGDGDLDLLILVFGRLWEVEGLLVVSLQ